MTAIPNTKRCGAIYWYRRSRCLPSGNRFRPTVSLRTACPQVARRRAAILTAKFEVLYMRLFGNPGRRFALDKDAAVEVPVMLAIVKRSRGWFERKESLASV